MTGIHRKLMAMGAMHGACRPCCSHLPGSPPLLRLNALDPAPNLSSCSPSCLFLGPCRTSLPLPYTLHAGILVLFMSMAYIAAALDASGVFAWLALKITVASGGRGMALFLFYFGLSAFMTTFTSNDVCMWVQAFGCWRETCELAGIVSMLSNMGLSAFMTV